MLPAVLPVQPFPDHALLDCGEGEKLERFGDVVLRRPDPQALWRRRLAAAEWDAAHLTFVRESDRGGRWEPGPRAPGHLRGRDPRWEVRFGDGTFVLRPTPFKHVGLFPEQAANWALLPRVGDALRASGVDGAPRLLNLFGYTGAASVLAAAAGWEVTHVDASKQAIAWTRENAERSGLAADALRVICDDALAFARREVRRGRGYHAILMDPPHYGRGPKGETWRLEEGLAPLVEQGVRLLEDPGLLVLSTYAVGHSPLAFVNLLGQADVGEVEAGELALAEEARPDRPVRQLPAGFCARLWRGLAP